MFRYQINIYVSFSAFLYVRFKVSPMGTFQIFVFHRCRERKWPKTRRISDDSEVSFITQKKRTSTSRSKNKDFQRHQNENLRPLTVTPSSLHRKRFPSPLRSRGRRNEVSKDT